MITPIIGGTRTFKDGVEIDRPEDRATPPTPTQAGNEGAALAVAMAGIAALSSTLAGAAATTYDTCDAATVELILEDCKRAYDEAAALLNRLGAMVGPAGDNSVRDDVRWLISLADQFVVDWAEDDGKDAESAANCTQAREMLTRIEPTVRAAFGLSLDGEG